MYKLGFLLLLVVCCSCSRSFPIRASLNHTRWFASLSNGTPRVYEDERLSLIFATDLAHPELTEKRTNRVTGCKGPCQRTQTLLLANIPLRTGLYRIAQSNSDSVRSNTVFCSYDTQGIKGINTRIYNRADGWLQIEAYDSLSNQVKGKFDIRFIASDNSARSVHFKRGKLNFVIKNKPSA